MLYGIGTLRDNQQTRLCLIWVNCVWNKSVDKALVEWLSSDFRRDMTWHGVTWRDMTGCDVTWHDVAWRDITWHDVTGRDMSWHNVAWRDIHIPSCHVMSRHVWHDVTWLHFCGECQMIPLKVYLNTALCKPQLQPSCSAALVPNLQPQRDENSGKPTQDSNPGDRIQNHKQWPQHYHCTHTKCVIVILVSWYLGEVHFSLLYIHFLNHVNFCLFEFLRYC